jgi:hypothetical protein
MMMMMMTMLVKTVTIAMPAAFVTHNDYKLKVALD